ncbi:phenylacetic acid degradation bifunctional protein PaaZ [Nitriliruptoraceae bacterium ZYF776]|nr:phenylacetic acid degradation bifunctional protein PaaZ [Profundirhabdus halotolerans]
MRTIDSFVDGRWVTPQPDQDHPGVEIRDAVTGELVGVSTAFGIDAAQVVAAARSAGSALRAMTFHERAAMLKELVGVASTVKDELYELSATTGATRRDAKVDVDGGIGTLATIASRGRRGFPDGHAAPDGPPEHLSRDGSFLGQHVWVPRPGVAVHLNAYNFPVWGSLEKLGSALLAGMPCIVKPAPQTVHVAERLFRALLDAEVLPTDAVQFLGGLPESLFDHLDGRDVVAFTGSAATAEHLRGHPAFTARSARFLAETDSLNSAILLPSAAADDGHLERFVAEVKAEVVTKAGQRCTAIRRAFVPEDAVDAVVSRLQDAFAEVTVGDPRDRGVQVGALVDAHQRERLAGTVDKLLAGCRRVVGDGPLELVGDVDPAAFYPPTILLLEDEDFVDVHELEPFGPVATVIPFTDVAAVVDEVRRGGGSLVTSVFGDADAPELAEVFAGIGGSHGRLLFHDATMAAANTGHGSPLPMLVHGGPGRAGGGEELGGTRGAQAYLQRIALQGSPDTLTRLVGRYLPGATRQTAKGHPFRLTFDDLAVGDALETGEREITLADVEAFAALTGDTFYAHMDEEAAAASPVFEGRVAHGYLVISAAAGLFVWPDPGPVLANYGLENLRFATPVYPGDRISVTLTCKDKVARAGSDQGTVTWDAQVRNQDGEVVAAYDVLTIVARDPAKVG